MQAIILALLTRWLGSTAIAGVLSIVDVLKSLVTAGLLSGVTGLVLSYLLTGIHSFWTAPVAVFLSTSLLDLAHKYVKVS